jgi:hypothetical protein
MLCFFQDHFVRSLSVARSEWIMTMFVGLECSQVERLANAALAL